MHQIYFDVRIICMEILIITLLIALGINLAMFLPAFYFKTDKLTDISYAVTFVVIAFYMFLTNPISTGKVLLLFMILAWAVRLGGYLLMRIQKIGRDKRFDNMRDSFVAFGRFWLLQAVSVWVIMLSSILFFSNETNLTIISAYGFVVWSFGLIIEGFSDYQKFQFTNNPKNKGKWIEEGLWKYSRHPNYLGEIMVWVGIYIFVFPSLMGSQILIGLGSPLFIIVLLLFVSGIPILEKSSDKKWGDRKEYQDYKKRVGVLLPKI